METAIVSIVELDMGSGKKKKKVSFQVEHNLPEVFGLSLTAAVENWVHRTTTYTAESLSAYINSKNTGYTCKPYIKDEQL